ncbi:hypothetical protein V8G54_028856 [Vigna mungo]|uniref:Uncharacterized protein n=1 Tax=Vigna mungo TaxID=3915 RepID=A0AAQ3MTI6_VIGMU
MVYLSSEMAKLWCFSGTPLPPSRNQVPLLLHDNKSNLIKYIYRGEFKLFKFVVAYLIYIVPLQLQLRRNHGVQRYSNTKVPKSMKIYASMNKESESETPQMLKIVVSGVTELLRVFSPSFDQASFEKQRDEFPISTVDDVLSIIKSDYDNAYFVTGNFTSSIYAEDCMFEDPTIKFRGRELYARNLKLLVPFFDRASIILQNIEKDVDFDRNFVLASWKLRCLSPSLCALMNHHILFSNTLYSSHCSVMKLGTIVFVDSFGLSGVLRWPSVLKTNLKLPWRPLISIDGSTIYELNENYRIVRHVESWNVSAVEAVLQIFSLNSGG